MDKATYNNFLDLWQSSMIIAAISAAVLSVLIFIAYRIKYSSAKGFKGKFDLASKSEINYYMATQIVLAIGIFFVANAAKTDVVRLSFVWLFVRVFIALCIGSLHAYIAFLVLKYYYPGKLSKKLERLRYTPRINPKTGNTMKLLSEDEEDAFLDEGMQAEEEVFSVDYDVWIDPVTQDTIIQKYQGHLSALECDRCGFQTLKLTKEEIIKEASEFMDGELQKEYKCTYCGRIKRKTVKLTKHIKEDSLTARIIDDPMHFDRRIEIVKIEIHNNKGEIKSYEFQSIDQAKHFLDEFDFEKLSEL